MRTPGPRLCIHSAEVLSSRDEAVEGICKISTGLESEVIVG